MQSLAHPFLDRLTFTASQAAAMTTLGEYRGKQELYSHQTPQILDTLKAAAMIESVESSNRLEGITADRGRIEALVLKSTASTNRSEEEIAGYRDALALIHEQAEHMPVALNTILQCHAMINRYSASAGGYWKAKDNLIIERHDDGSERVRFRPVSAAETPGAMARLVERYEAAINEDQREPLLVVPLAVLDFLCIHPFADGNGRCSRLLTLLTLYHAGYDVGRFISLERVFEQSKETYYEVLERSSQGWHEGTHDVHPWLNYFWGVLTAAYREFEDRVGTIQTARGSKTELVKAAVRRRIAPFAISDLERDCPEVSRDMIRVVLNQLREAGLVAMEGKGRGAKWRKLAAKDGG